jgi:hypothetical protein
MQLSILTAFVLGFIAFGLIIPAWRNRKKAARYDSWPDVTGEVISVSRIDQTAPSADQTSYTDVVVRYQYRAGGQLHFDSNVIGTFPKLQTEAARTCAASYTPGATINIYCDPADSNHSLLKKPVIHWRVSFAAGCGLLIIALGVVLFQLATGL